VIKNPALLRALHEQIHACERRCGSSWNLEAAHIIPRRMGGGSRMDTEDNVLILCRECHRSWGHGRTEKRREEMRSLLQHRPAWLRELLQSL